MYNKNEAMHLGFLHEHRIGEQWRMLIWAL